MGTYTAITALFFGIYMGYTLCVLLNLKHVDKAYNKGFDRAKEIYYIEPMELKQREERAEEIRKNLIEAAQLEAIEKENTHKTIPSDVLMAYGVSKVKQLPKSVLQTWNVSQADLEKDLDELLQDEVNNYAND